MWICDGLRIYEANITMNLNTVYDYFAQTRLPEIPHKQIFSISAETQQYYVPKQSKTLK